MFLAIGSFVFQSSQAELGVAGLGRAITVTGDGDIKGIALQRTLVMTEAAMGLTSVVIGLRAKTRSEKSLARIAMGIGLITMVFAAVHLIMTWGVVFGSGNDRMGSLIAIVLALVGCTLSWLVLRSHSN
ncbi:hypothetical protein F8C76_01875 [Flagellimonas olearia]|uniref:Uncharacterized protein n=1 Tax=Flagellimonas olearia TaxID=552546 RepID=A0A6I1E2Z0_9FLAO|nr:DUF6223 family protein [Allomuricauda olearia]KAB7530280.1 hypothetical protein F8C76_01875 [Allomuricauda olearia]